MINGAQSEIYRLIRNEGAITFARFMDIALYCPDDGYYRYSNPVGPKGDFYTAPGAHPAFGALLAIQIYQMWSLMGKPDPFWIIEVGAGSGLLCYDLLNYTEHLPKDFQKTLNYLCLDLRMNPGIEENLPLTSHRLVDRVVANRLPLKPIEGCILSNELFDTFPVHRVQMQNGELKEIYVTIEEGQFREYLDQPSTPELEKRLRKLDVELDEGNSAEINLGIENWIEEAVNILDTGYMLSIDYGSQAAELYSQEKTRGTLTCFYKHSQNDDPYINIGRQDITAQVDFTTLIQKGLELNCKPIGYVTQNLFLSNLGLRKFMSRIASMGLGQIQRDSNRMGMLDLMRPGGLGDFKVLVQCKNAPGYPLWGVHGGKDLVSLADDLPIPLLSDIHMPLLEGRYPHLASGWRNYESYSP